MLNSLFVTRGKDIGKTFTVTDKIITIGRDFSNSVRLEDDEVSRLHCSILFGADDITLVDESSSNGTFLNGTLIKRSPLVRGDQIQVGRTQFIFDSFLQIRTDPDSASPQTVSPTRFVSSQELTHYDQSDTDTRAISLKLDTDNDSTYENLAAKAGTQEAGRQFVQVKNDLRFVYRASLATTRTLDTPQMLRELMGLIFDWVEADRGCVFLKEPESNKFTIKYVKNRHDDDATQGEPNSESPQIQINKSVVEYVTKEKVGILSPPCAFDEELKSKTASVGPLISEVMCVPIECRGELFGLLYVDTISPAFSESTSRFNMDHLRLMLAMAHQAAVSIENEAYYRAIIEQERLSAVAELTGLMSHRINNILQGLNGGSHLLQSGLDQDNLELCRKGWEIAQKNQGQISKLVTDLLLLSKPLDLSPVTCDVAEIIRAAIQGSQGELVSAGMSCQFSPAPGSWNLTVDQKLLTTALENLIRLATEASIQMDSNQPIEIQIGRNDQAFEIRINYRGLSICRENSLVGSFEDTIDSDARPIEFSEGQSGGIELAVGEKIVLGHHGTIELSKNPEANQISISLPIEN